ncbi:vWA domain-containing protein [Mycobacterium sp. TY815]|uniref:vWA domain-containing protein n=1 Tax=Mycobacterium sp. TY815 TaxID=3050581 RepID=UPI00274048FB|nr:vWA domain-containing protein [Mycobacterium sp. TY815]MDP7705723.1 VWA domain-containing protein [Mycobacterium sp. TY815]
MTFEPVLPWPIFAVVAGALVLARLVALRQVLLGAGSRRTRTVLRWGGVTLAVLLVIAAATRPALPDDRTRAGTTAAAGENLNVFLIVDRSVDSGVDDYGDQARIAGMRDDIAALIKRYPAARYALIDFAARATLDWPLSEDVWSLRPTIAALDAYRGGPNARVDVDASAAGNVLRYQLIQAAQQYPGTRNVVLYFGSGAPGSTVPQGDFASVSVDGGAVLGYGRTIDEAQLRKIAGQLVVPYQHREPGQPFQPDLPDRPSGAGTRAEAGAALELYWLPALLAAVLLLGEIYLSVREFRRGRLTRRDMA